jgi:hypothetical protein
VGHNADREIAAATPSALQPLIPVAGSQPLYFDR